MTGIRKPSTQVLMPLVTARGNETAEERMQMIGDLVYELCPADEGFFFVLGQDNHQTGTFTSISSLNPNPAYRGAKSFWSEPLPPTRGRIRKKKNV